MRHAPCIAKIRGIPLRVHWSFLVFLALILISYAKSPLAAMVAGLIWFLAVFASVVVHEAAHSMVALRRGLTVRDIVLLPIGGVSEILRMRRGSSDELTVSLAGPLASFALALLLCVAALAVRAHIWPPTLTSGSLVVRIMWANLLLGAFNLLPALPFDGGRVLRAALARREPESEATATAARLGIALGYVMLIAGIFVDFWVGLIGLFVIFGARSERQVGIVRERIGDPRVADVMVPQARVLDADSSVADASAQLRIRPELSMPVVRDNHYLGMIAARDVMSAPPQAQIDHYTDHSVPLLSPDDDLYPDAAATFSESHRNELAVGTDGRVVGMLYLLDVNSLLRRAETSSHSDHVVARHRS